MRWLAHVMVFLLSCAALANSLLVQVQVRSGQELDQEVQISSSGSMGIYKTEPGAGLPQVRQTVDTTATMTDRTCRIGYCQDV